MSILWWSFTSWRLNWTNSEHVQNCKLPAGSIQFSSVSAVWTGIRSNAQFMCSYHLFAAVILMWWHIPEPELISQRHDRHQNSTIQGPGLTKISTNVNFQKHGWLLWPGPSLSKIVDIFIVIVSSSFQYIMLTYSNCCCKCSQQNVNIKTTPQNCSKDQPPSLYARLVCSSENLHWLTACRICTTNNYLQV